MSKLTPALALRAAINLLRDSAESRRMPSGEPLNDAVVQLHLDAADTLEESLADLRDHEQEKRTAASGPPRNGLQEAHGVLLLESSIPGGRSKCASRSVPSERFGIFTSIRTINLNDMSQTIVRKNCSPGLTPVSLCPTDGWNRSYALCVHSRDLLARTVERSCAVCGG
ncbi:hypothetical protein FVF58_48045 [Paraburkholderia panacisoli]|uniref:Uncharacterized protein n=1 Tax=Paraburkholderia panacisoli TaxID=2603818 RepID=A0A5B0G6L4_9BURK|nr:hypothetical protein FVF58_48045 [Paraburkholderia panacisoli]